MKISVFITIPLKTNPRRAIMYAFGGLFLCLGVGNKVHMADVLVSPAVGGAMWAATAGVTTYSVKKIKNDLDDKKIPLMGVMGAFIFAAQMINFSIGGTSGHLGGGLLLAILLGPYAGFLTMLSILTIQALFFSDGGYLALGCNAFNLGFYTCFIAYPLLFKNIVKKGFSQKRLMIASILSAVFGLQFGAFGVVLETLFSGKTELPFGTFVLLMQPIHLAIGIVEGIVTASVVAFIYKARPEIIQNATFNKPFTPVKTSRVLAIIAVATIIIGGALSWFASSNPDGLEWSIFKSSGQQELKTEDSVHQALSVLQNKTAILPDYNFKSADKEKGNVGTSLSGIIGSAMVLGITVLLAVIISIFKKRRKKLLSLEKK